MNTDNENGKPMVDSFKPSVEEREESHAPAAEDSADTTDLAVKLAEVAAERDRLAAAVEELQQTLLRRQADFENFRKRIEREKSEFADYSAMEVMRELLPVLDDLERARAAVPPELGSNNEFVRGVQMIYDRLSAALKKLGLEPIDSAGQPFDPNIHHAVDRVPTTEADDHTVLEEWQKGYNFRGKLLREAMVRVAVAPSMPEEPED